MSHNCVSYFYQSLIQNIGDKIGVADFIDFKSPSILFFQVHEEKIIDYFFVELEQNKAGEVGTLQGRPNFVPFTYIFQIIAVDYTI